MIGALGGLLALRLPLLGEIDLWLLRHIGILRLLVKVLLSITSHIAEGCHLSRIHIHWRRNR